MSKVTDLDDPGAVSRPPSEVGGLEQELWGL